MVTHSEPTLSGRATVEADHATADRGLAVLAHPDSGFSGAYAQRQTRRRREDSVPGCFTKQNRKMLKARLSEARPLFKAKQGSMVAYQGDVNFACEGSGGMGKMFKTAMTSEGMALMKVSGDGDVFLADRADDVFNTTITGTGTLTITVHGTPVALNVDVPTFVDMQAAVLWSDRKSVV